jgi:signal transduction histidine kinase
VSSPTPPASSSSDNPFRTLQEKIALDNRFRLGVSIATVAIAILMHLFGMNAAVKPILAVVALYSLPYGLIGVLLPRLRYLSAIRKVLSFGDFAAITAAMTLTGGLQSPFFFLYPVPFLIHAFHFDLELIAADALFVLACFVWVAFRVGGFERDAMHLLMGQGLFLAIMVIAAFLTAQRFRRKERTTEKSVNALRTTVQFLEDVNGLPPTLSAAEMQKRLKELLSDLLRPLSVHSRLWILNVSWKTLEGIGEHPALRPGAPNHLPTVACPAFALRTPFRYHQQETDPCRSEQFNYSKHLCIPVRTENESLGVLFLGSYDASPWLPEDGHLFEMLAHSVAMALQRKRLFETLQEKVSELNYSFEVGATGLATLAGSTQSIDEATVNILDGVRSILKVDRASLMLWDADSQMLRTQCVRGGDFKIQSPMQLSLGEGMAGWALKTGEPYWAEYALSDPHYKASAQSIHSLLCVPVFAMDRTPLGVINAVTMKTPRVFTLREINFLKWFGQQAALAIENAQLHHRNRANIEQLKELNTAKSHFLSLVSHDLRGPLTGVRGFCDVLKMEGIGPLNDHQRSLVLQLERQVDLQERMVDDLLDLARMERGQLSIVPEDTDLEALLREEVAKIEPEAVERQILLQFIAEAPVVPIVKADGARLRQVTWNLIHNALKFTPERGRVTVKLRRQDDQVAVIVEDTGVGLSAETQSRVFEKFFQVSPGGSRGAQGLGLGLAICKEIVLAHRGKIQAESAGLGLGTRISFSLPLDSADKSFGLTSQSEAA